MKYFDLTQGSPEWFAARAGIPTSSCFDNIITPKTMELSKSFGSYANHLIAELLLGKPLEDFRGTFSMERGGALEDEAARLYQMITGDQVERGGFCTDDAFTMGASPDRRILRPDGTVKKCLEIKVPNPETHVANMVANEIDRKYYPQVQGQMLVTGAEAVDWISYHPEMAPVIITTPRDDAFIAKLEAALDAFHVELRKKLQRLVDLGYVERIPEYKRPKETGPAWFEQPFDDEQEIPVFDAAVPDMAHLPEKEPETQPTKEQLAREARERLAAANKRAAAAAMGDSHGH